LLLLAQNIGYAPANNIALGMARAPYVCFLNSDVFPINQSHWIGPLCDRLGADPQLGAVAPILLYEDGSVQHEGMVFESIRKCGGWLFPRHCRKGMRPAAIKGLMHAEAITAACMVMRTADARMLGGFDEIFAIGDFEDADLCQRLRQNGLTCAVDHDVRLHHLERRSQAAPSQLWRRNLTLYNAWLYRRRWKA
jgi:GT2 family glycosyltransferase